MCPGYLTNQIDCRDIKINFTIQGGEGSKRQARHLLHSNCTLAGVMYTCMYMYVLCYMYVFVSSCLLLSFSLRVEGSCLLLSFSLRVEGYDVDRIERVECIKRWNGFVWIALPRWQTRLDNFLRVYEYKVLILVNNE